MPNIKSFFDPATWINMRAGHFPKAENNGLSYLKLPLSAF